MTLDFNEQQLVGAFPQYEITWPEFASGGFKSVYRIKNGAQELVLKIMKQPVLDDDEGSSTFFRRFEREIDAMRSIDSDRVVKIDAGPLLTRIGDNQYIWYTEPYYPHTLQVGQPHDDARVITFMLDLLEAVEAIASAHMVHRDIKPDNIVLDTDGKPVLLDLGIARHLDSTAITGTFDIAPLTHGYAAPEQYQIREFADIDTRTDLFLLGVLAYELRTGRLPFDPQDKDYIESLHKGRPSVPGLMDDVGTKPCLQRIISRLMSGRRNKRYRDCAQLRTALTDCT